MLVLPERERTKKGAIGVETKGVTCKIPLDLQKKGFLPEDKVWSRKIYQQIRTIGKNRLWGMWCYVS